MYPGVPELQSMRRNWDLYIDAMYGHRELEDLRRKPYQSCLLAPQSAGARLLLACQRHGVCLDLTLVDTVFAALISTRLLTCRQSPPQRCSSSSSKAETTSKRHR